MATSSKVNGEKDLSLNLNVSLMFVFTNGKDLLDILYPFNPQKKSQTVYGII